MAAVIGAGDLVVYRAPHVRADEPGEEGVVTRLAERGAFVRFGLAEHGRLCPIENLTVVTR